MESQRPIEEAGVGPPIVLESPTDGHRTVAQIWRRSITGIVGTAHFVAPEVFAHNHYSFAADWWACGVLFYECVVRKHLFDGHDEQIVFQRILKRAINLSELVSKSDTLGDLTGKLLDRNPYSRLGSKGAADIRKHPFFDGTDWEHISGSDPLFKPEQDKADFVEMAPEWTRAHFYGEIPVEVADIQGPVKSRSQMQQGRKLFLPGRNNKNLNRSSKNTRLPEIYSLREIDNEDEDADASDSLPYEGMKIHPF